MVSLFFVRTAWSQKLLNHAPVTYFWPAIDQSVEGTVQWNSRSSLCLQWNTWSKDQDGHRQQDYNKDEVASGFQNFLICIEMFFAALAHAYAFPPKDYLDPSWTVKSGFVYSLRVMFDVRDVVDDVEDVVNDTVGCEAFHRSRLSLLNASLLSGLQRLLYY